MGKTITFGLSVSSIEQALKELESYQSKLQAKADLLRQRVANRLAAEAQQGFNGAVVDDLTEQSGSPRIANVNVTVSDKDTVTLVIANGEDAIWVEFGAGVYHNGSVGSSPNPYGAELGYTIGNYGHGRGKQEKWAFKEGDVKIWTHGTPARMPMYRAVQAVVNEIPAIAKEVFAT